MSVTLNNLVNDPGDNLTGTQMDKAEVQALLMGVVVARTDTGAVNNWAPGLDGHTLITWAGASDATVSGLAGGIAGQRVTVRNTGTKVAYFLYQSGLSSAGNKFTNAATSGSTPIAPGGWITYQYDGTTWQLVAHEQGDWITPTFAAGNYVGSGAMTWTLAAGDVTSQRWWLRGKRLSLQFMLDTTTVGGTPATDLKILNGAWGGYLVTTGAGSFPGTVSWAQDNSVLVDAFVQMDPSSNFVRIVKRSFATWGAATNTTSVYGGIEVGVA